MTLEILKDLKNDLMNRRDIRARIKSEKNPSQEQAVEMISSELKADKENIVVDKIQGSFGSNEFIIAASIYNSKEDKEKIEPKPKTKEGEAEAPKPAAPAAPAAATEEKPAEEKKEEAPKEEPKAEEKPAEEPPKEEEQSK